MSHKTLQDFLDGYYHQFGVDFPMMQAPNVEKAIKHIGQCLYRAKPAEKLYPNIYGAMCGKRS